MKTLFIDTGAFVARFLKHDRLHNTSLKVWRKVEASKTICQTSTYVLNETTTLLARHASPEFAVQKIQSIYLSKRFQIVRSDESSELTYQRLLGGLPVFKYLYNV